MDKIISARVDESAAEKIGALARRLGTSKKRVIEQAIELLAASIAKEQQFDVLEETFGAWSRKEPAEKLVEQSRKAFRDAMHRHRR